MKDPDALYELRQFIRRHLDQAPKSWRVEEGPGDEIGIDVDGAKFTVRISPANDRVIDDLVARTTREKREAFARSLDDAEAEDRRNGPLSPDALRHDLDVAKARGVASWLARRRVSP